MKTAPGSMAMFMASQSAAVKEADELRRTAQGLRWGALPVLHAGPAGRAAVALGQPA
jgi:hypothetical protein